MTTATVEVQGLLTAECAVTLEAIKAAVRDCGYGCTGRLLLKRAAIQGLK